MAVKFRTAIFLLFSAAMLISCRSREDISAWQGFSFDTYSGITICGAGGAGSSSDILETVQTRLSEMSGDFLLCYDTAARELPEKELYTECIDRTKELNRLYGDKINITCGALTGLWGISTDSPAVPEQEDILQALELMTGTDYPVSIADLPEGVKLDFGAVAKGYALDRISELLPGTDYAVISLSSSTLLYGSKPDGEKFRTGITNPETGSGYLGIIESDGAFISTSGGYERYFEAEGKKYSHILDTRTGYPAETDLVSVTVIVPADTPWGGIKSDFLSTLIYIEGSDSLEKWLACDDIQIVAADGSGSVYTNCKGFILDERSGYTYG